MMNDDDSIHTEMPALPPSISNDAEMVSIRSQKSQGSAAESITAKSSKVLPFVLEKEFLGAEQLLGAGSVESASSNDSQEGIDRAMVPTEDGASLPGGNSPGQYGRTSKLTAARKKKIGIAMLLGLVAIAGLSIGLSVHNANNEEAIIASAATPCVDRRNLLAEKKQHRQQGEEENEASGVRGNGLSNTVFRRRLIQEMNDGDAGRGGKPGSVRRRMHAGKSNKSDAEADCDERGFLFSKSGKTGKGVRAEGAVRPVYDKDADGSFVEGLEMCMPMSNPVDGNDLPMDDVNATALDDETEEPTIAATTTTTTTTTTEATTTPDDTDKDDSNSLPFDDQTTACGPITCPGGTSCIFIPVPFPVYDCLTED